MIKEANLIINTHQENIDLFASRKEDKGGKK